MMPTIPHIQICVFASRATVSPNNTGCFFLRKRQDRRYIPHWKIQEKSYWYRRSPFLFKKQRDNGTVARDTPTYYHIVNADYIYPQMHKPLSYTQSDDTDHADKGIYPLCAGRRHIISGGFWNANSFWGANIWTNYGLEDIYKHSCGLYCWSCGKLHTFFDICIPCTG